MIKRLAPVATVNAAERAADHARARLVATQPNRVAKMQTLFAEPDLAKATEQVARKASRRPLADPAGRIPTEKP